MTTFKKLKNAQNRILSFPDFIIEGVNKMILSKKDEGGKTYTEITKWLNDSGYKTSHSAVGRYGRTLMISRLPLPNEKKVYDMTPRESQLFRLLTEIINLFEEQEAAIKAIRKKH